ncbi:MAG: ATP-binding protein [Geobacteraceae bacterium]|nr:ATP-binding protein [Geobacteraceae bacterium]
MSPESSSINNSIQHTMPELSALYQAAEERQQRSLMLSESITAANLRFIETGNINQMAQILIDACMTITNSPFGVLYEILPDGNASILSLSLASFDSISEEAVFRDIKYEIRRHGHYLFPRHHSLLLAPLIEDRVIIVDSPAENRWAGCSCAVCAPHFSCFAGMPLKIGTVAVGMIGLANRSGGYHTSHINELENYAQTCALAINGARADIERKAAQEQLRQAQKMEAIGQLAGGIAHDFNNLLTVINGYSTLVLQKISSSDQMHKEVEQILNAGERAATLVRQLLAFGRRQVLEPRQLNINSLIASLHKILCRLIGENISLATHLSSDIGLVKADPSQIEQIIMNLVINARDAFESGGSITIETANRVLDDVFVRENKGAVIGSYIMIAVKDSGMGMSEECIKRIFEPFFCTKELGNGSGLGLATVYGIVKQSGGYIQVQSEIGIGSEFRVFLPRQEEIELDTSPREALQTMQPSAESGMILIVEDEKAVLDMAALTLRSQGCTVLTASGPLEALKIFERFSDNIDLLLTDIMMPDMTGPEMAKLMRDIQPDLHIVFMSGYADGHIRASDFPGERIPFIMKPFNPAEMTRIVKNGIGRISPASTESIHE